MVSMIVNRLYTFMASCKKCVINLVSDFSNCEFFAGKLYCK